MSLTFLFISYFSADSNIQLQYGQKQIIIIIFKHSRKRQKGSDRLKNKRLMFYGFTTKEKYKEILTTTTTKSRKYYYY